MMACMYPIVYSALCCSLNHAETFANFKRDERTEMYASLLWHQGRKNERKTKMERAGADRRPAL